mgnify:FL=1
MEESVGNADNITWVEGEPSCRWKGELTSDEHLFNTFGIVMFNIDYIVADRLVIIDGKLSNGQFGIYVNGETYQDCIAKYVDYYASSERTISSVIFQDIKNIQILPKSVNISELICFQLDLDAWYGREFPSTCGTYGSQK